MALQYGDHILSELVLMQDVILTRHSEPSDSSMATPRRYTEASKLAPYTHPKAENGSWAALKS